MQIKNNVLYLSEIERNQIWLTGKLLEANPKLGYIDLFTYKKYNLCVSLDRTTNESYFMIQDGLLNYSLEYITNDMRLKYRIPSKKFIMENYVK